MKIFILILFVASFVTSYSQTDIDTTYRVEISTTASSSINFFRDERYPGGSSGSSLGYGVFIRGMWHPGRMLAVGLMSGYSFVVSDEFEVDTVYSNQDEEKASANLKAIPLQLVISMQYKGLELGVGMGPYLMRTTINYGSTAESQRIELGLTFIGLYRFSIGENFSLGPELRVLYLSYRGIISVMPSITLQLDLWRY
ncbi:MAG: hypothetical protein IH618_12285 [Ignavibacteriaceae bacterium]|nr:hypothetical protein [Ignavibacteriaceae bacterium]